MKAYVIRVTATGKMADIPVWGACYEGEDGQTRAEELATIHNRLYPNAQWHVATEEL